jgi:hypothetical protein
MPWNGHASRTKQQSKHTIPASIEVGTTRSYFEQSRVPLQKVWAKYEKVSFLATRNRSAIVHAVWNN